MPLKLDYFRDQVHYRSVNLVLFIPGLLAFGSSFTVPTAQFGSFVYHTLCVLVYCSTVFVFHAVRFFSLHSLSLAVRFFSLRSFVIHFSLLVFVIHT